MDQKVGPGSSAPGWNTFGLVAPSAQPPRQTPPQHPQAQLWHLVIPLALLGLYFLIYGWIRCKLQADSPERRLADRWLWCWPALYTGQACLFYKLVFGPFVLLLHALRIYLPPCVHIYAWRAYWLLGGCCSSFFVDQDFPPNDTSLGKVSGDTANESSGKQGGSTIWVRAMHFSRNDGAEPTHPTLGDSHMHLFEGKIEAQDILQGALGDCWLLAAMATLAEHEGAMNGLFHQSCVQPDGKYSIRLFDPQVKEWKVIVIDDFVPCTASQQDPGGIARLADRMPKAMYARPHGKEIWTMLLEKAFAKLCGSYASIEAGITEWGIAAMTGGSAWRYERDDHTWNRMDLVAEKDSKDKRACGFKQAGESHDDEEFFLLLRYYHRQGAVLCCGGVKPAGQQQGLVVGHAFSLLQVRAVFTSWHSEEFFRMVQIRNPWGTGEWKGPWSDASPLWEKYPHVRETLQFSGRDDGTYWMQWEDFCQLWGYVGCVDYGSGLFSMRLPVFSEEDAAGPVKACFLGCARFWCLCEGPRHFLFTHEASAEHVESDVFRRSFGCDPRGAYCRLCERDMVHIDGGELEQNARGLSRT
mmetsp:Transcript_31453/g.73769  ORF Transcript_31453/g.73769 Transcript_31453/m.73769 type:complete len:583 (-) Transcript_31453:127-1875(-)